MREKLHKFFAGHDSTGGGLRWHPDQDVASPGIDDPGYSAGPNRSFAGLIKRPPDRSHAYRTVHGRSIGNHLITSTVRGGR